MRTGIVEANLVTLNETAKLTYLEDLIAQKRTGPEKGTLDAADMKFHEAECERLTKELESAHEQSTLAETPSARLALNDLLVRLRLGGERCLVPSTDRPISARLNLPISVKDIPSQ
jgi:hypothetical protein